jgi:ribose transport system substrate-binding protein
MKKIIIIGLILVLGIALFAQGAQEAGEKKYVVGVTLMSLRHPFFQEMKDGMDALVEERGDLIIRLTDADFDAGIQSNQINDFIQQKVDGIVVTPCDSKALGPSVQRAIDAGIPVVTVDVAAEGADVVTHVASDNVRGGEIAAGLMIDALKERGVNTGVVVIVDHTGVTSTQQRNQGFTSVMSKELPNIQIEVFDAVGQRDKAMSVTEDAMQRFGSSLVGIFGVNDDTSLGALSAVERANRLNNISIVGYDAGDESRAAIMAGKIVGNTIQLPAEMGRMGIEALLSYIKGERTDFPDFMPVPVGTYTKDGAQMVE